VLLGAFTGGAVVGGIFLLLVFSDSDAFTSSSTAPIGLIFLPFFTILRAIPGAIGGGAIGYVVEGWRRGRHVREPGMAAGALVAVLLSGWGAATLVRGFVLGAEVRRIELLSEPQLGEVLQNRLLGRNPFILAAVAGNPRASGDRLDRIAHLTDPRLHEAIGSVFKDVMGRNRKGLAVMRLVAQNPNVRPDTLELLAGSPDPYVRGDVAANPKLSATALERLGSSQDYLVMWGVSRNPSASLEVLERLSRSGDRYTRLHVASNPTASAEVRERLMRDPDELVRNAAIRAAPSPPDAGFDPGPRRPGLNPPLP